MNLPCEVVRDLLPLYAEQLTGEESARLIQEHLETCPDCKSRLGELERPETVSIESVRALQTLKKDIRKRRWRTAALVGLAVFLLAFCVFVRETGRYYIPYEAGMLTCEQVGDDLVVRFHTHVTGTRSRLETEPDGERVLYLEAWRNQSDVFRASGGEASEEDAAELYHSGEGEITAVYYVWEPRWDSEDNAVLVYGRPVAEGLQVLPRLVLGYYALLSLALAAVFGLLLLIFRKKKAAGVFRQLLLASLSWLAGHGLVRGFSFASFDAERDFLLILTAAAAVYALLTLLSAAARQRKRDRA